MHELVNECPQDRTRIYYPRIGEDLIDYAVNMGTDVAKFDLSALSVRQIANISLTGVCVKGMLQQLFIKPIFLVMFIFSWHDVQSVLHLVLLFARTRILKSTGANRKYPT